MTAPGPRSLVAPADLRDQLGDPRLRVLDATTFLDRPPGGGPYLVRPGLPEFRARHLPGAVFADVGGALSVAGAPRPFTLPDPPALAAAFGLLGVGDGTQVVVYSQSSAMWATRVWWLLRYLGHDAVAVLDGGLDGWVEHGFPVAAGDAVPEPARLTPRPRPGLLAVRADVERAVDTGAPTRLVNALPAETFRGEGVTSYSRPGRIPGSVNVPWSDLVDPRTQRWPDPDRLRSVLDRAAADDQPVIAYCGGGISATVDIFAWHLSGRDDIRLYDGSLAEWSADPRLPLERD